VARTVEHTFAALTVGQVRPVAKAMDRKVSLILYERKPEGITPEGGNSVPFFHNKSEFTVSIPSRIFYLTH
jgi:hypothetical protein